MRCIGLLWLVLIGCGEAPAEPVSHDLESADFGTDSAVASDETTPEDIPVGPDVPRLEPPEPLEATGFYYVIEQAGRWFFVTPTGEPFWSLGVNHTNYGGYVDKTTGENPYQSAIQAKYASQTDWAEAVAKNLEGWGFNTIGAWSSTELFAARMPYTVILNLSGADWITGEIPDYFAPEFEARCQSIAAEQVAPRKDDPNLVGWFSDNELHWGPDWRAETELLEEYLAFPEGSPGRVVAESFEGDARAFLSAVSERYFEVTTTALRAADPNHLVLGIRSVSVLTPPEVPEAAASWLDVYSVNNYVFLPGLAEGLKETFAPLIGTDDWLAPYHEATGLPLLITEMSFRAKDSGLPNSWPPIYPTLETQKDRADAYAAYTEQSFLRPFIIGQHWFLYFDEPPGGRFDGEDSNFGLVNNDDQPYTVLTDRMTELHANAPHRLP